MLPPRRPMSSSAEGREMEEAKPGKRVNDLFGESPVLRDVATLEEEEGRGRLKEEEEDGGQKEEEGQEEEEEEEGSQKEEEEEGGQEEEEEEQQQQQGQKGSSYLIKHWEYRQANVIRLLKEELDCLNKQRLEVELKKLEILEEHRFEKLCDKIQVSVVVDDLYYDILAEKNEESPLISRHKVVELEGDQYGTTAGYWKQRALNLEALLEASMEREDNLMKKLEETICNMEKQYSTTAMEEKRADNFLHFILQNAPIVIAHLDKELRYRFIYNHFPTCIQEELIGKTDDEIFSCAGVKECLEFKREVLERGLPGKREITFESKTFLVYVEPVFDKADGATIGVNYIGMDITDQVKKREKMAKLREELAVQKTMETELNRTIHLTEETMRVKQALATMSHEIRSPLSGVVSMAEILSHTNLDNQQRELLDVMISSGELVLNLINDILDLSKVESGVMELEATKFRPREVVKHVLHTAAASLKKNLTLEGSVAEDIPVEVIGDVLRLRQILTNLVSNATKFTEEGKVGIRLNVELNPSYEDGYLASSSTPSSPSCEEYSSSQEEDDEEEKKVTTMVWLRCDVYDTGIGIPEHALPTLFQSYVQVSADHARKYGGTGLGLAICKQLVHLMGGYLTVTSKEHEGSMFTFVLPFKVSPITFDDDDDGGCYDGDGDGDGDGDDGDDYDDAKINKDSESNFHFQPKSSLGGYLSSSSSSSTAAGGENQTPDGSLPPVISNNDAAELVINPTNRILLVEDNSINVTVAQQMMKRMGHTIDVVRNGREAVQAVQRHGGYDLIFMDVCMPVMDGLQATRIIRAYEDTGNWNAAAEAGIHSSTTTQHLINNTSTKKIRIPIIAMTANLPSETAQDCYANGMDFFVSKPLNFPKLRQCLQQYLT